ncbi:hypothetical protein [Phenylobacterium sp.]|uniref:hypothetical protein n=1 Tax=Phenylobacterium sp. TaxID=1871053 RepID=UPI0030F3FDDA
MRFAASCAAAFCMLLAGCVYFPDIRIYNQTGQELMLHLTKVPESGVGPGTPYDLKLEAGKRARIRSYEFSRVIVISSGGCDYNYGAYVGELWKTSSAIVVQIEPDFVAHLLNRNHTRHWPGRFRDDEARGFPIKPVKTCGELQ